MRGTGGAQDSRTAAVTYDYTAEAMLRRRRVRRRRRPTDSSGT